MMDPVSFSPGLSIDTTTSDQDCVDTGQVASEVLQWLTDNHIHHTVFARTVLSWSAAFTPLLRRPTPWHATDTRTRAAYRAMAAWLRMSHDQRLHSVRDKQERANRKRRTDGAGSSAAKQSRCEEGVGLALASPGDTLVSSPDSEPGRSPAPVRRARIQLTALQRRALSDIFLVTSRPSADIRREIADVLQLPTKTVANFFSSARTRGLPPSTPPSTLHNNNNNNNNEGEAEFGCEKQHHHHHHEQMMVLGPRVATTMPPITADCPL